MQERQDRHVLDAALPAHWGTWQRVKNTALYGIIRASFAIFRLIPFPIARGIAVFVGNLAALVDWRDQRRALANLAIAFPEASRTWRFGVFRRMFVHLAISAVEVIHTERFMTGPHAIAVSDEGRRLLDQALAEGHGAVLVGGHIGNWEICGQLIAKAGYPITSIAKPLYDPRLTRLVHVHRSAYGHRILWRGDAGVAKEILRLFKHNGVLGLLIDQDTKVQGTFVPFFGKPAYTPTAAASFALRTGAAVLCAWAHRVDGVHQIHFERCPLPQADDHDAAVALLTAHLSARLEAAIRARPEQWVWLHQRFKTKATSVDTEAAALNNRVRAVSNGLGGTTP
ncbi:MAG: lysophospholipid acyltransferase family protein [Deltaproteobacteria bacterium]|nr:lysophospholipid acyltransferase family protein [Deltaproteobacteria bacterium]